MAKNKKKKKGPYAWRLERQTIEMMRFTEYVSIGVSVAGVTAMVLSFIQRSTPWLLAAMAILVLTVVLDILYPAYFTLIPAMKEERKPAHDMWHVWVVDGFMFLVAMQLYNLQEAGLLWLLGIACGVVIAVVLGLWAEEFKREKYWLVAVFLVSSLIGGAFLGYCNIEFDNNPPEVYTLEVESLSEYSGPRRITSYYCTVRMPDGEQKELRLDSSTWHDLEEGGPVKVIVGQGALGVAYITVDTVE